MLFLRVESYYFLIFFFIVVNDVEDRFGEFIVLRILFRWDGLFFVVMFFYIVCIFMLNLKL